MTLCVEDTFVKCELLYYSICFKNNLAVYIQRNFFPIRCNCFSAFWQRLSVGYVFINLISDMSLIVY